MRDFGIACGVAALVSLLCLFLSFHAAEREALSLRPPEAPEPIPGLGHDLPASPTWYVPGLGFQTRGTYNELANAPYFVSRYAGASFKPSPFARDLDVLASDPMATTAFLALVHHGSPAGQVYGLCGLYLTNLSSFLDERDRLRAQGSSMVRLFVGCSSEESTVSAAAKRIGMGCGAIGL